MSAPTGRRAHVTFDGSVWLAARFGELIDLAGQCRQRRPDGGAVRRGQPAERIADAPLVRAVPVGELTAPGVGEGDRGDPPVGGVRSPVDEAGLDELLHQGADGIAAVLAGLTLAAAVITALPDPRRRHAPTPA
jgi:type IV secretory pathway TrbD component